MAHFKRLNDFLIEIADVGNSPKTRTIVVRHTRLPSHAEDLVEITPGARIVILGGRETKLELRRALEQIGRHQLSEYLQSPISGSAHHQLLDHLNMTRKRR